MQNENEKTVKTVAKCRYHLYPKQTLHNWTQKFCVFKSGMVAGFLFFCNVGMSVRLSVDVCRWKSLNNSLN